jgi:hypothetical protein
MIREDYQMPRMDARPSSTKAMAGRKTNLGTAGNMPSCHVEIKAGLAEAESRPLLVRKKLIVRTFARSPDHSRSGVGEPQKAPLRLAPKAAPPAGSHAPPLSKPKSELSIIRAWLRVTWPALFCDPPKPLVVGIHKPIMARASEAGLRWYAVGVALRDWTRRPRYLEALAADRAMRWGLDGEAIERVASEHQALARRQLADLVKAQPTKPASS